LVWPLSQRRLLQLLQLQQASGSGGSCSSGSSGVMAGLGQDRTLLVLARICAFGFESEDLVVVVVVVV
jgi:hypothetical protein